MKECFDIPYSRLHADRRVIDVFLPEASPNGAGIYWIHGGGFAGGSKAQWHEVCRHFCGLGYACASVEYRLAPEWKFPAWVEDVRLGMSWFRRRAGEYGFSPGRVAAAGSSAGGYLALMLATIAPDDDLARSDELDGLETRPNTVAAYCPATSMHEAKRWPSRAAYPKLMPAPESAEPALYRAASVEDRIVGGEPPILFLHGTADELIPLSESADLCERITGAGGRAELVALEGVGHGFGYGTRTDAQAAAIRHVERFLEQCL